jgi:putative Mg2+ transporter-C (MgtC) family protein
MLFNFDNMFEIFIRLLTAAILGGLIGLEREFHGRPAGLRTHILVCLGSAIIIASSQFFQEFYILQGSDSVFRIDPSRIAAGVVTGIGFLGGGAIVKSEDIIRGLTTAACIWFVAAIGIVVGSGMYAPAIIGTILGLVLLIGLNPIDHLIPSVKYEKLTITSELENSQEVIQLCSELLKKYPVVIQNMHLSLNITAGQQIIKFFIRSRKIKNKHEILNNIISIPRVLQVSLE